MNAWREQMTKQMHGPGVGLAGLVPPVLGQCHVWRLPITGWTDRFDLLDERERAQHDRFRQEADRLRYQAAHIGLRLLLGGYLSVAPQHLRFGRTCRHCAGEHGKPYVTNPSTSLDFSLTHSGDRVAIAVAAEPVGVDVEQIVASRDIDSLAPVALSPDELVWLAEQPADGIHPAFFGYWARKEALLKATGHGLAVSMAAITLSPPDAPAALLSWAAKQPLESSVQLHDLDVGPGYSGSVAVLSERTIRVTQSDFTADSLPR